MRRELNNHANPNENEGSATEAAQNPAQLAQVDDPQRDELLAIWEALDAPARQDVLSVARGLLSRQTKT